MRAGREKGRQRERKRQREKGRQRALLSKERSFERRALFRSKERRASA
jgi:hypothetical protein